MTQAIDFLNLVFLHQIVDATDDLCRDFARTLVRSREVERNVTGDAEIFGLMVESVGNLSVFQQRLRRDATNIEADSAPVLLFDDSNFLA